MNLSTITVPAVTIPFRSTAVIRGVNVMTLDIQSQFRLLVTPLKACFHMASYSKEFTTTALGRSDDSLPDEGGARSEGVDGVFDAVSLSAAGAVSFLEGGD
eukprot:CAMPEP_0171339832 /NCGR_PEP_ID=MMETSP0878-20121228/8186_1 /TAXON_ID=67004 /ORGANISM="Thalassiosira weissflogii, Strain CCMP1336" /LENGTH=100 /DNA_ID=CAMNT_0011841801 /DNA_START=487 /DNA_END=787 /DNA_ORIENTATION=+